MTLTTSKYYHIYNYANGFENMFNKKRNYCFFSEKYRFYILPMGNTQAYCQMPNCFHFLMKIKSAKLFSKLISYHAQSISKVYNQVKNHLVSNYKPNKITLQKYFKQFFIYIYNNAVKHRFAKKPNEWNFSWHNACIFEEENFAIKNHILNYSNSVELLKAALADNHCLPNNFIPKN